MFVALGYKTIFIKRNAARLGLTLVEFLVALGLVGILAAVLVALSVNTGRSFAAMVNYVDLDAYNRVALDYMSRELRQVKFLSKYETNRLTFVDNDGHVLSYEYHPEGRRLIRTKDGSITTLISDCDSLNFGVYERVPLAGSFDLLPAATATNCKVISIQWSCSRRLFGLKSNTEDAQVSHIVLRNKQDQ